ncbi:MAG: hypothetical protein ACT4P4_23765 [Betaproteobacteria bacterium]
MRPGAAALWYQDAAAWRLFALGYLPLVAGLNLAWEAAHLPLYTLWKDSSARYLAFVVAHCTLGDVLIGSSALLASLIAVRARAVREWRWRHIGIAATALGVGYTMFSEWMNLAILGSWAYAESMPVLDVRAFEIGLSPLAQWLVIPPLALALARRTQA